MAHCSACGAQLGQAAQFCSSCGRPITALALPDPPRKGHPILWAVLGLILLGAIVRVVSVENSNAPNRSSPSKDPVTSHKQLPDQDKAFVTASLKYLSSANRSGTRMAEILAGASTGSSTLADCHSALLQALADENKDYSTYRADRARVPIAFEKIDRQITQNHTNVVAGLKTMLSYWQNGNLDSISRGTNQYKSAIQKENATIAEINKVMQDEAR